MCTPLTKAKELVRLSPTGAPIFSLVAEDTSDDSQTHRNLQVFCGNADKSVVAWEPPDDIIQEKVSFPAVQAAEPGLGLACV